MNLQSAEIAPDLYPRSLLMVKRYSSDEDTSSISVPVLLPFVKSFNTTSCQGSLYQDSLWRDASEEPTSPPLVGWVSASVSKSDRPQSAVNSSPLHPLDTSYFIHTTTIQRVWQTASWAPSGDRDPLNDRTPNVPHSPSFSSSSTVHSPWEKPLQYLCLVSLGAAVSACLYANPLASLKALILSPSSAAVPSLSVAGQQFIETAQRQLYHLDRVAAEAQRHDKTIVALGSLPALDTPAAAMTPPPSPTLAHLSAMRVDSPAVSAPAIDPPVSHELPPPPDPATQASSLSDPPRLAPAPTSLVPPALSDLPNRTIALGHTENGELLGLLDQGDRSIALFRVNGTIEQVQVGEKLGNGATFTGTDGGKAVMQMGNSEVPLAVGQGF